MFEKQTFLKMDDFRIWSKKQKSWFGEPGPVYRNDLTMNISDCALTRQQKEDGMIYYYIILSICGIFFVVNLYLLITACREDCRQRKEEHCIRIERSRQNNV